MPCEKSKGRVGQLHTYRTTVVAPHRASLAKQRYTDWQRNYVHRHGGYNSHTYKQRVTARETNGLTDVVQCSGHYRHTEMMVAINNEPRNGRSTVQCTLVIYIPR
jgi:hypothetical protein